MMEKGPNHISVEILPIPFHNYDPINVQPDNTGKISVALQHTSPLHYVVYQVLKANLSTAFNLLIWFKRNRLYVINVMNDGKNDFIM